MSMLCSSLSGRGPRPACPFCRAPVSVAPPCVWQTHRRLSLRPLQSIAAAGTGADAGEAGGGGGHRAAGSRTQAPWTLTFDLKERDTQWTEENQARLVRIVAGYQLNLATEEVERRLDELSVLLPQVAVRCAYIKPSTLAELLRDPAALVARLLQLRQLMPGADISALAAAEPELLLLRDVAAIQADLARLRQLLGDGAEIDGLVQQQPQFLDAQLVSEVLAELRRLVPHGDPVSTLLGDTSWLLRVERGRGRLGDDPD